MDSLNPWIMVMPPDGLRSWLSKVIPTQESLPVLIYLEQEITHMRLVGQWKTTNHGTGQVNFITAKTRRRARISGNHHWQVKDLRSALWITPRLSSLVAYKVRTFLKRRKLCTNSPIEGSRDFPILCSLTEGILNLKHVFYLFL